MLKISSVRVKFPIFIGIVKGSAKMKICFEMLLKSTFKGSLEIARISPSPLLKVRVIEFEQLKVTVIAKVARTLKNTISKSLKKVI